MKTHTHPNAGNLLLLMSGSIACAKASSLISEWHQRGGQVKVVCSRNVFEFIGPATLQGLGAELIFDDVFAEGQAMEHIALGQWADVILAAPATSNLINKLAAGIADDAVTTVWQAAYGLNKPMFIAPAMNTRMWLYPATQQSVERLQQWGVRILPVGAGQLACGEVGEGRLLEPSEILKRLDEAFKSPAGTAGKRILITAGGTREPIDSVRYIGNISSGRTASILADDLSRAGHNVTWLGAEDAIRPTMSGIIETYVSFSDLQAQLQRLLASENFDAVIHAAAVSDFSVAAVEAVHGGDKGSDKGSDKGGDKGGDSGEVRVQAKGGKLPSDADLVVRLQKNPKLLSELKTWSVNPDIKVIGFKLTDTHDMDQRMAAVKRQFERSKVDAVVHNDLSEISESTHTFNLHGRICLDDKNSPHDDNYRLRHCENAKELAMRINEMLEVES